MRGRSLLSMMAIATLLAAGCPTPPAPTTGPGPEARLASRAARPAQPPPRAPRGPDIGDTLLVTLRVGALHRLDGRLAAMAPAIVPRSMLSDIFTRRLLPGLVRELGLNPLALDALDLKRPMVIGLLVRPHSDPGKLARLQGVALVPLRDAGTLIQDAIKVSYPDSEIEEWGGIAVRRGSETRAWVRVRGDWAVVAPSAPLLDSAYRHLEPMVAGVAEGTLQLDLRWARLVAKLRPAVQRIWSQIRGKLGKGRSLGTMEALAAQLVPLAEQVAGHLASIRHVEANVVIRDDHWGGHLEVTPIEGGKLAGFLGGLEPAGRFGLDLLPGDAVLLSSDRPSPDVRVGYSRFLIGLFGSYAERLHGVLPSAARTRGLLDGDKPVPFARYRRALRDLNLKDYRTSYALYRMVFDLRAFLGLMRSSQPELIRHSAGPRAYGLYATKGPGLRLLTAEKIANPAAHRKVYKRTMLGYQRLGNRLVASLWKALPDEVTGLLGKRPALRLVYRPVIMRLGRVAVSGLELRLRWPRRPRGRGVGAARMATFDKVASIREIVEMLLGKGNPTYAWAYVGDHLVTGFGRDFKPALRALVSRAAKGGGGGALEDRLVKASLAKGSGKSELGTHLFAGSRLSLALLDAFQRFVPQATRRPPGSALIGDLRRSAESAGETTLITERRLAGRYRVSWRIPVADVKTLLVGAGALVFMGYSSAARGPGSSSAPAQAPVPVKPVHPRGP